MNDAGPANPPARQPTAWQRLQSFFRDVLLLKVPGPPEPPLELWLRNGRLMLVTPGAIYSREERYTSFAGAFRQESQEALSVDEVLVLGFGMGSIALILERIYGQTPGITGVELDPRVISLAREWCPAELMSRTNIVEADALEWVPGNSGKHEERFGLVCVDLFIDTEVPQGCSDPVWLQQLAGMVKPGGRLLVSRIRDRDRRNKASGGNRFRENFNHVLAGSDEIRVSGNDIFRWTKLY